MTTFTKRIAAGADDGFVRLTAINSTGADVLFGKDASAAMSVFLRFTNITIPQGAYIQTAKLTFIASASLSGTTVNMNIVGNDVDDAVAPTTAAQFTGLARTTATVNWQPAAWTNTGSYDSPSIVSIVQEIVDRAGFASGNDMQFMMDDNGSSTSAYRQFDSYEGASANAALLTVEYTTSLPSNFFLFFS